MIRLGVLFPEHLNLNGDYGNLEVIARQLEWREMATEIVAVGTRAELTSGLDFLLIGHGSSAAWASIDSEFRGFLATLKMMLAAGMLREALMLADACPNWLDLGTRIGGGEILQKRGCLYVYESKAGFQAAETDMAFRRGLGISVDLIGPEVLSK